MVRYRSNDYSVTVAYAHHKVQVRAYVDVVVIGCGAKVIARYRRSYYEADMVFDPMHFLPLLEQKVDALDQAAPLQGWDLRSPRCAGCWKSGWASPASANTSFAIVARTNGATRLTLRLLEIFETSHVHGAVRQALNLGAIGYDAVKHLVLCRIERRPPRLDLDIYPYMPCARAESKKPASYMSLMSEATA